MEGEIIGECLFCKEALVRYHSPRVVENLKKRIIEERKSWFVSPAGVYFRIHERNVKFAEVWLRIEIPPEVRNNGLVRKICPQCLLEL